MLYRLFTLVSILAATVVATTKPRGKTYEDYVVARCDAETREKLDQLHELEVGNNELGLDFWLETRRVGAPVDIMMSRRAYSQFSDLMEKKQIKCSTMIADVEEAINNQYVSADSEDYFGDYHNWTEVYAYLDSLAAEFPSLSSVSTFGTTYEGRPMKYIYMSTAPNTGKPALWFDGGLHAREWVTVTTVMYVADTLLRGYGIEEDATYMLDTYDIYISPILNVDGYDYTWNEDRMWRKTRSPNTPKSCVGTDPNRNWAFHWGEAGASPMACSDSYQGPSAASEIEVQTVQSFLYDHRSTLMGYINFHSYSQMWMSPWGYTETLPADYAIQDALSADVVKAIKAVHGKVYEYGTISRTVYPASGSSADYTYGVCGIVYSYGAELRDTGEFGFLLPTAEIIPQGEEIYAAILTMGKYIDENAL